MHQGLAICAAPGYEAQGIESPASARSVEYGLSARNRLDSPDLFGGERKLSAGQILFHVLGI